MSTSVWSAVRASRPSTSAIRSDKRDAEVTIVAQGLSKIYRVQKKPPGLLASVKAVFQRTYTDVRAVDDVNATVRRGELVGFLGPNGAGKTTTLKMMAGLLEPTTGSVRVLGYEPFKRERPFQRRFALVLGQKNQLWWDLPASESFLLNKEIYGVSDRDYRRTLDELSDLLDLRPLLDVQVRKLSLGERMKCELAAALLHKPDVLFLDERTIGLDVVMQQKIREFIGAYQREHHATILLTSHYMDDVKALCSLLSAMSASHSMRKRPRYPMAKPRSGSWKTFPRSRRIWYTRRRSAGSACSIPARISAAA